MTFSLSESILNFKRSSLLPNHLLYFSYSKAHLKWNSIAQLFQKHYYVPYRTIWNKEYIVLYLEPWLLIFHFRLYFPPIFIFLFSSIPLVSINQLWLFAVLGSPRTFYPSNIFLCLPSFLSTKCSHQRLYWQLVMKRLALSILQLVRNVIISEWNPLWYTC